MTIEPKVTRIKIAEDELSVLWEARETLETDEQIQAAAEASACSDFWATIESYADYCDKILVANGYPKPLQMVHDDGEGEWRPIVQDLPTIRKENGKINLTLGYILTRRYSEGFSDVWYAAHLGFECRTALEHLSKYDGKGAFLFRKVFEISAIRKDWLWRRSYKKSIITGRKQRKNLNDNRRNAILTAKEPATLRKEKISLLLPKTVLKGGALVGHLSNRLLKDYGISVSLRTIRRDLRELRGG